MRIVPLSALCWACIATAQPVVGDLHLSYAFNDTGETLNYRLYVPPTYDGSSARALVVVLHGYGGNQDSAFDQAPAALAGILQREADRHDFIVVSPAGYTGHGDYGAHLRLPVVVGHDIRHSDRDDTLALADVLQVVRRVRQDYRIDPRRLYVMGNSMGMTGTLFLAEKHRIWCAIGPSDGPPWPGYPVGRLKYLSGAIVVNGAKDQLALSAVNRRLADRLRSASIDTQFVEIAAGDHGTAWYYALPAMFDFFAEHHCSSVKGKRP